LTAWDLRSPPPKKTPPKPSGKPRKKDKAAKG